MGGGGVRFVKCARKLIVGLSASGLRRLLGEPRRFEIRPAARDPVRLQQPENLPMPKPQ
jgi:hypothetical protein